jgi:hypothetical protein
MAIAASAAARGSNNRPPIERPRPHSAPLMCACRAYEPAAAAGGTANMTAAAGGALAYIFDAKPHELQPGAAHPAAGFSQQLRAAGQLLQRRHAAAASQPSQQATAGRLGPARVALDPGSVVGGAKLSEDGLEVG